MGKTRSVAERLAEARANTERLEKLAAQEHLDTALEEGRVTDVKVFETLTKDLKSIRKAVGVLGRYVEGPEGAEARELVALLNDFDGDLVSHMEALVTDEPVGEEEQ